MAEHDPDLVVGDFNATADHEPMRSLADAGYRDVGELANEGWQPTWPSGDAVELLGVSVPSLVQIDHVLVGPRLAAPDHAHAPAVRTATTAWWSPRSPRSSRACSGRLLSENRPRPRGVRLSEREVR